MKRQAVGIEGPPMILEIEKGAIRKFAEAVGDLNPLWTDEEVSKSSSGGGVVAMPTFLRSMRPERPQLPFDLPFQRLLDAGSEWEYFQPVRPGDRITAVSKLTDISERSGKLGTMIFMIVIISYTNHFGQVVATQQSTHIRY
jgi:acyl dehydratase